MEKLLNLEDVVLENAVNDLVAIGQSKAGRRRDMQMSGEPHYKPKELQPYLGYDQRVGWQIIVEWFWMFTLAGEGLMPPEHAVLMTRNLLRTLLANITTTKVTDLERRKTKHDILALLQLMRKHLPQELHRWLHLGLTSYDTINTAFALQARYAFEHVMYPKLCSVDLAWRLHIERHAETLQIGRTHLQDALPITVGAWLAVLHNRFVNVARNASKLSREIPGKFSGAVGTRGAIQILGGQRDLEGAALRLLSLPEATPSTQIVQPEGMERFYNEIALLSAVLANLGDDVRHLQSSAIEEVTSASSTSSTMSHKGANPIAAEQADGMHVSVRLDFMKVLETMNSTLQRDLRFSNVMRSYPEILVFTYQQLLSIERMLKSFSVNIERCRENFDRKEKLVVAELLHLSLQQAGFPNAHQLVNKIIVPRAAASGNTLDVEMAVYLRRSRNRNLKEAWESVPQEVRDILAHPKRYIGDAAVIALRESENMLA